jgi:hypothetical protein
MTDVELIVIIPTRSRPEAVERVVGAWKETRAFADGAVPLFVYDDDDPAVAGYRAAVARYASSSHGEYPVMFHAATTWRPLVPKLNRAAHHLAVHTPGIAIGFAGDDHLPRTPGWVAHHLAALRRLGTGVVSCSDGYRKDELPTQWVMTSDIVAALGAMVPGQVEHLYCDNIVHDLAREAGAYAYLLDVLVEHVHPVAGKAASDEQYDRVNGSAQYKKDRRAYREWRAADMARDVETVRRLREGTA